MRYPILAGLCALIFLQASCVLAQPVVAGFVKTISGKAEIKREAAILPATTGLQLLVGDTVITGGASTVGIMLEDDTLLSLGPSSTLNIDSFVFQPQNELFGMAIRLLKGSFAYMSGVIGHLAPEKVRIETPDAIIATHGTRFVVSVEGSK